MIRKVQSSRWLCSAFFFLLLPFSLIELKAQWISDPLVDEKIQRGIDRAYNLEYSEAEKLFSEVVRIQPDHPAGYFFQAMVEWLKMLTNFNDESRDGQFIRMLEKVIELSDKRLEKNSKDLTALFYKGGAIGFRGRLRANRGSWVLAAKDGVLALPLVKKAHSIDPNNSDVLLGIGIYNYYAAVIPQFYPLVKPFMIFFPKGDKREGIEQLELASQNAKYARVEASYFLMQNYYLYEKEYWKALELATSLHKKYDKNPIFQRYLGRCYVSLGMWSEAERVFAEVERRYQGKFVGYDLSDGREAYYYLGRSAFLKGDLDKALRHYQRSNELSTKLDKGGASGFTILAYLTMGMILDLQKKRQEAIEHYKKVLKLKQFRNSHADARRYLQTPYTRF